MNNAIPSNQSSALATTEVTGALNTILNTDKFLASPQMSAFLRYVVEQTLIGNTRRIKAFTVGIEALGKPASFDPQTDPSVRVLAKRLRSSLDTYYAQNLDTDVFIEMKPGSYVPKFLRRSEMPVQVPVDTSPAHFPVQSAITESSTETESSMPATSAMISDNTPATAAHNTDIRSSEMANAQTASQSDGPNSAAHLSVQQQNNPANRSATESAESAKTADQSERKSSISQLWQAYKSTSKVA